VSLGWASPWNVIVSVFIALALLVGQQKGHLACNKAGCWFVSRLSLAPVGCRHHFALMLLQSSVLWHCWFSHGEGIQPVKSYVDLLLVTIWLELCTSYSSSCCHSPPPSSFAPKIPEWTLAYPGCRGYLPLNECHCCPVVVFSIQKTAVGWSCVWVLGPKSCGSTLTDCCTADTCFGSRLQTPYPVN